MSQAKAGGMIEWNDPVEYVESFLGFKRYFTLEYQIMKCLYKLASDPPDELKNLAKGVKVVRRQRVQTAAGAAMSALFGLAFGLQNKIFRAAGNHKIQSPGGQITKELQAEIWHIQPPGCNPWLVMPMNGHDELETPCKIEVALKVKEIVNKKIEKLKEVIPLISMSWEMFKHSWGGGLDKETFEKLSEDTVLLDMNTLEIVKKKDINPEKFKKYSTNFTKESLACLQKSLEK